MNQEDWQKEFEKIKKIVADGEEEQIETVNNLKQELMRERDKAIIELNEIQRRINILTNIIVFNVV